MGATSVTGVSGFGAAEGNKGPDNRRNQFVPLRSPHVVAAGVVDEFDRGNLQIVPNGTATVKVPGLTGNDYGIFLTVEGVAATTAYVVSRDLTDPVVGDTTTGDLESFMIYVVGTVSGCSVNWAVVKNGL